MTEDSKQSAIHKCFATAIERLQRNPSNREIIRDLAKDLENLGYPKDWISSEISRRLSQWVDNSYVRKCLEEEYKRKYYKNIPVDIVKSPEFIQPEIATTTEDGQVLVGKSGPSEPDEDVLELKEKLTSLTEEVEYYRSQQKPEPKQEPSKAVVSWPEKIRVNISKTGLNAQTRTRLMQMSYTLTAKHIENDIYEVVNE